MYLLISKELNVFHMTLNACQHETWGQLTLIGLGWISTEPPNVALRLLVCLVLQKIAFLK